MNDSEKLEYNLTMIKPNIIIHLAAISSSHYAFNNPIETLETNGLLTAKICDLIHKNKWNTKLFNASSSEIYKGHINYTVEEDDDKNMFHLHPYSIAKIMAHSMVDFYRKTYELPFSNGVIFTTESKFKKPVFLLNKIAKHIKQWKSGEKEVLKVGNLDSYKNILHAKDVANAIKKIIEQEKGENYLICSKEKYKVLDLVLQLYSQGEIELEKKENVYFEKNTDIPVLIIENGQLGVDSIPINIIGNPTKLINLGWKPQVPIEYILKELLSESLEYSCDIQGIIPLGGNATRMNNLPKFLLPCKVNYTLLDNAIDIFNKNGIFNIISGVSETNNYILKNNNKINKVVVKTKTMAETVYNLVNIENKSKKYVLIMPDTYFSIKDEINDMMNALNTYQIVVLLWKIKDYQIGKVGQCKIENGFITDVIDKDVNCDYEYFWGCIGWNSSLNKYINPGWETIGDLIKKAIELEIPVGAIICNDSYYYDCGTYPEYFKMIKNEN